MRTSLNNIKAIDDYLMSSMAAGDALVLQANMLLNSDLTADVNHQRDTYTMIRQYSRKQIKDEIIAVQKILATAPQHRGFRQRVANLFNKH